MKPRGFALAVAMLTFLVRPGSVLALDGEPYIHDPSTIMECDGKYYTFGTRGGGLISDDGWTWKSGAVRPGGGAAPDAVKIGDRYLIAYSATGGGLGGGHSGRILTMWNRTLDPESPDFEYTEAIEVAASGEDEDCDAIDAGLFLDPATGRLWCTYGTYFGFIRVVELDPETGKRVAGNEAVDLAIDCEATTLIQRDGWYYLLGTHGTCCSGATSTYNIRVGRSRIIAGPYLDHTGMDMMRGGGKLVVAANNRLIGAGHFGLIDLGDGVQKFSCHYEASLDDPGHFGVLDIRALLWKDGWPVAGDYFMGGTFELESARSGYALEMGVDAVPFPSSRVRLMSVPGTPPPGEGGPRPARTYEPKPPIPDQDVAEVSTNWPSGTVAARLGDYMLHAHQKWTISPVDGVGGYLGSPFFRIAVAGTDRTLCAAKNGAVVVAPAFTGADDQLWRIDQLTDGTYRIMPKAESGARHPMCLTAVGVSTPSLATFDPDSFNSRWNLKKP